MKLIFFILIISIAGIERACSSPLVATKDAHFHETVTELMKELRHEVDYIATTVFNRLPNNPSFEDARTNLYSLLNDIDFYKANYNECPFVLVALDYDVRSMRGNLASPGASRQSNEVMGMMVRRGFQDTMSKIHVAAKKLLSEDYHVSKQLYENVCYSHVMKTSLIDVFL